MDMSVSSHDNSTGRPEDDFLEITTRRLEDDSVHIGETSLSPEEEWQMGDPLHDPSTKLGRIRNKWGAVVNSDPVQWVNIILIVTNAACLGVLTFYYENESVTHKLEFLDKLMMIAFTLENASQLFYHGKKYFENSWLIFDGIIVVLSAAFNNSAILMLRTFRIFRVFLLISKFKSFKILVKAISITLPRLYTIMACMTMFFYVFMVLFTNLYHDLFIGDGSGNPYKPAPDSDLRYDYFGRLDRSFLTLFQIMLTTSWSEVVRQVVDVMPSAYLGFYIWIILADILFMNLVVAIICGSLMEMNKMRLQMKNTRAMRKRKRRLHRSKKEMKSDVQMMLDFEREIVHNNVQIQKALLILSNRMDNLPEGYFKEVDLTSESLPGKKQFVLRNMAKAFYKLDKKSLHERSDVGSDDGSDDSDDED